MGRQVARTATVALVVAIVLIGAWLRLDHLGKESVWLDEAFSLTIARSTPAYIIETTSEDVHPPLYYFLLYGWVHAFGGTPWTGRLLSVVASLALLVVVFEFGRRIGGRSTGIVAAGLLAISPFHVEYAQEIRMYAWLALLATGATYCLWRLVMALGSPPDASEGSRDLSMASHGPRPGAAMWWAAAYAVLASALTLTHVHGWFVLAAHACTIGLDLFQRRGRAERVVVYWIWAMLGVAAIFLLWLPTFTIQVMQVQAGFWIPRPEPDGLIAALQKFAGAPALLWILGMLALLGVAVAWRQTPRHIDAPRPLLFLLPWLAVPLLVPFGVSFAGSSIFLPKYTIAASVPFALLAALALSRASRWWQVAAAFAIGGCVVSLSAGELRKSSATVRKDQWREIAAQVEQRARPGDVLIFHPFFTQIPYDIYRTREDLVEAPFPKHAGQLTQATLPYVLDRLRDNHRRVWLILMSFDARKAGLVSALEERFRKVERLRTFHVDAYLCEDPVQPSHP